MQLRKAGAAARAMFVQAAAKRWGVPAGEITVKNGVVSHASGKQATFAELVADAAKVTPPQAPAAEGPEDLHPDRHRPGAAQGRPRQVAPARPSYTQDVHLPNMLTAMVAHSPRFGGKVKSFDAAAAREVPGVVDVFQIPTGVAVMAENTWAARQGRDAARWSHGTTTRPKSAAPTRSWPATTTSPPARSSRLAASSGRRSTPTATANPPAGGKAVEVLL